MHVQAGSDASTTGCICARLPRGLSCASASPALLLSNSCAVLTKLGTVTYSGISTLERLGTTIAVFRRAEQHS